MRKNRFESGFSLIEISIVLIIIGILTALGLRGQELIETAKIKAIINQINDYRIATQLFTDTYHALPGDFSQAALRIDTKLKNGNGDGRIAGPGLSNAIDGSFQHEALHFWHHLAAAKLIPPVGTITSNNVTFLNGAPGTKMGGGFTIREDENADLQGVWILLGKENGNKGNKALLTPQQAQILDTKMDDGIATTGLVKGATGEQSNGYNCTRSDGTYDISHKKAACILYFHLK